MSSTAVLRVLNIGQNYRVIGGADVYFLALEKLLRRFGHEVIPFAATNPENFPSEWSSFFPVGADFDHPGPRDLFQYVYSFPARAAMARLLASKEIDLAHLHIYYGKLTGSILGTLRAKGIPMVQTLHEYKIVCPTYQLLAHGEICQACGGKAFWLAVRKRCNRGSLARSFLSAVESYASRCCGNVSGIDHFIAVSDFVRNKMIELGLPAEKVTTVHNFVDANGTQPNRRPGEYFLYFGRIERVKGIFTLIDTFRPLRDQRLFIVGGGSAQPEVERIIKREGLNHIRTIGFKVGIELENLIRRSICTITPSQWYETFGLTLLETFALGRPVVVSSIGGMTEIVSDGVDGFLSPPGDADALREKILWMAAHRQEAAEMGMMGRRKVEERFNPDMHYQKIISVYRKVMGR
ncbi:MAG: glycosyltransferase family 4 protein [Nitrospirota bacterium]|nr:glycosyltransferase family 4 protein [Nitrospirota bacterium]